MLRYSDNSPETTPLCDACKRLARTIFVAVQQTTAHDCAGAITYADLVEMWQYLY